MPLIPVRETWTRKFASAADAIGPPAPYLGRMTTNALPQLMGTGLVIGSPSSGGGLAMMGILVLIGAVAGLVYVVRGRR